MLTKVGNIERNIKSVTQRIEVSKYCWRNRTDKFAQHRVATNPQIVKKKKKKQYLQSAIKYNEMRYIGIRNEAYMKPV